MKVKDLIRALIDCDLEAEAYIWIDGLRYPICREHSVDQWDKENPSVDINAVITEAV